MRQPPQLPDIEKFFPASDEMLPIYHKLLDAKTKLEQFRIQYKEARALFEKESKSNVVLEAENRRLQMLLHTVHHELEETRQENQIKLEKVRESTEKKMAHLIEEHLQKQLELESQIQVLAEELTAYKSIVATEKQRYANLLEKLKELI